MIKRKAIAAFLAVLCIFSLIPVCSLGVSAETAGRVYAEAAASVKQGEWGYCYIYIDSPGDLAALNVSVYYDSQRITVNSSYNSVPCALYDKAERSGCLQYSYIFDGEESREKTCLFYFRYRVNDDAAVGGTYFDVVVSDAYDSSLNTVGLSGSRHAFSVSERKTQKTCYIYGTSRISTSVKNEFELSYRVSDRGIASGAVVIQYDPELFEIAELRCGAFLDEKLVDVNTSLSGSAYLSFAGDGRGHSAELAAVRFRTLKNVDERSEIKLSAADLYDSDLNSIFCTGYTTAVQVVSDPSYTDDKPAMILSPAYSADGDRLAVTVRLEAGSHLGAGDFVLKFDTDFFTYASYTKGFSPSFFNVNDKKASEGELRFSVISLKDIVEEQTVLTAVFDVSRKCEDAETFFEISGSGLSDSLTEPILLNFIGSNVTVKAGHSAAPAVIENSVQPTCTEDGSYDEVVYCSVCGAEFSREKKTSEKQGHDYASAWTVDIEPDCTSAGSKSRHCTRCDSVADVTEIPANGHAFGEWKQTSAPTCTDEGAERRDCASCDFFEVRAVSAAGHSAAPSVIENSVQPTCTEDGSYDEVVYCSVCGAELSREKKTSEKQGHDYAAAWTVDVEPDCTSAGSKSRHCTRCDSVADVTEIPANGHDFGEWKQTSAPTCTDEGAERRDCASCDFFEVKAVSAAGHSAASAVIENSVQPTCTEDGSYDEVVYCSVCGAEISREKKTSEKQGHDYASEWTVDVEPDCTSAGSKSRHCTRCDSVADVTEIPANGHAFGEWKQTSAPTCTDEGAERRDCANCDFFEVRAVSAAGHSAAPAVIENSVQPTCTEDGSYDEVVYCSVCGAELSREKKTSEKQGHDYAAAWTVDVEPDCTSAGSKSRHCTRCDSVADVTEIPANGHAFGEWREVKAATFTEDGENRRYCAVCDAFETQRIPKLSESHTHDFSGREVTVSDATCTAEGSKKIYCTEPECGEYIVAAIGKTPHVYNDQAADAYLISSATCISKAVYCKSCSSCGAAAKETFEFGEFDMSKHTGGTYETVQKEATCEEDGSRAFCCASCDNVLSTEVIRALGHRWIAAEVVEATPGKRGYTVYVCENDDGHTYIGDYTYYPFIFGDVNNDGRINGDDVIYLLNYLKDSERYPIVSEEQNGGDFNRDGAVDRNDAVYLLYSIMMPARYPLNAPEK